MKKVFKAVSFSLGLMVLSSSVHAAQSNFQISPPPIAMPEFSAGKVDKKVSATYVGITGTGLNLNGAGANLVTRRANSDTTALDTSFGAFLMSGTMNSGTSKGDLLVMNIPFSVNFEFQPVKNDNMALILFGGPMLSLGLSSFKFQTQTQTITGWSGFTPIYGTTTDTMTSTTTTLLYGAQGGAQIGINAGGFTISPFAMFQSQQGTASTTTSSSSSGSSSSSSSIPTFTSTSYGMDILYRPWNMTLSSMLQEAAKSGSGSNSNEGFKTTIISLSWNF